MKSDFIVIAEVYSFNDRRTELDMPPLAKDGFEYTIELIKKGCGCLLAEFDSQEGKQPFQLCFDRAKALQNAEQTRKEVEDDIARGYAESWFGHIQDCNCN